MQNKLLTIQDKESLSKLLTQEKNKKIVLVSHKNPDGDALGSVLGLNNLLKYSNHETVAILPNAYPEFLKWMPGNDNILIYADGKKLANEEIEKADIIISLDFNDLDRLGDMKKPVESAKAIKILIDHHPHPSNFSNITCSETNVSSTSELLYLIIEELGLKNWIDKDVATSLYVGIMTDTGNFSFNSSKKETFDVIGELLGYGIDKDLIYSYVYNNYSFNRMKLMGFCLHQKMKYFPEYNTAYISISKEDKEKYNFQPGDSEGFVNLPLSIEGVKFSALFTEKEDKVRISFRSKGNFPVNKFSTDNFNGGGHLNAAGGESDESLSSAINKFEKLLPKYKDDLNSK